MRWIAPSTAEVTLRRGDSPTANPKIFAEAKPSLRSRSLEQCAQASAGVKSLDRLYRVVSLQHRHSLYSTNGVPL